MLLIDENLIRLKQSYKNKDEVIQSLAYLLEKEGRLHDVDGYIQAVQKREQEVSTNLGDEIAIPHGRCEAVKEPSLVFATLQEPIVWGEEAPVKMIFQIAVPESSGDLHLQILSKLARKLIYKEFIDQLLTAETKESVLALLDDATGGLVK